jgi:hypothetical protein
LQSWESQIKDRVKFDETEDTASGEYLAYEIDDFDLDMGDGVLYPILASPESAPDVADRRSQVGDNPPARVSLCLSMMMFPLMKSSELLSKGCFQVHMSVTLYIEITPLIVDCTT